MTIKPKNLEGVYALAATWFIRPSGVTTAKQAFIWLGVLFSASACSERGRASNAAKTCRADSNGSERGGKCFTAERGAGTNRARAGALHNPLLIAAATGDLATLEKLLAEHADVAVQEGERSAITLAAQRGHRDVVRFEFETASSNPIFRSPACP